MKACDSWEISIYSEGFLISAWERGGGLNFSQMHGKLTTYGTIQVHGLFLFLILGICFCDKRQRVHTAYFMKEKN